MAGTPSFKVYCNGEYVAACKYPEDAAVLVSAVGGIVKYGHKMVIWTEGSEKFSAGESYDGAGEVMRQRIAGFFGHNMTGDRIPVPADFVALDQEEG